MAGDEDDGDSTAVIACGFGTLDDREARRSQRCVLAIQLRCFFVARMVMVSSLRDSTNPNLFFAFEASVGKNKLYQSAEHLILASKAPIRRPGMLVVTKTETVVFNNGFRRHENALPLMDLRHAQLPDG